MSAELGQREAGLPSRTTGLGSMAVEVAGQGPPVVAVHGLGGSSNSFEMLMAGLGGFRVWRPDLPGAGRSSWRPGRSGLEALLSPLRDCLRAASIARCHLVGHSLGALICQHLAAESPDLAASLTLFGPILEPSPQMRDGLSRRIELVRRGGMAAVADDIVSRAIGSVERTPVAAAFVRESLMRQDPTGYVRHCEILARANPANHDRIACSTLLVTGDEDRVAPIDGARVLEKRIHGARLEIVSGAGHWVMAEAPQSAARMLREHLDAADGGS